MADSKNAGSSSSSSSGPDEGHSQEIRLIGFLARQAGLEPDASRIAGALSAHAGEEPLERIAASLPAAGLKADVCRMPLASALWQARASLPLVIHTEGKGFTVVGVPSGDFLGQEYGSNKEISSFCTAKFGIKFPMAEKGGITPSIVAPPPQPSAPIAGATVNAYVVPAPGQLDAELLREGPA